VPPLYHVLATEAGVQEFPLRKLTTPQACVVGNSQDFVGRTIGFLFVMEGGSNTFPATQRFEHLTRAALEVLQRMNLPGFEVHLPNGPGGHGSSLWLPFLYRLAWERRAPLLRAEKLVAVTYPENPRLIRFIPYGEQLPQGGEKLFPHDFHCLLQPDVFSASVRAMDVILDVEEQADKGGKEPVGSSDLDKLPKRTETARDQYLKACASKGVDSMPDREAYDMLDRVYQENGTPSPLPEFSTWTSYLRRWHRASGQQKRMPRRAGRGNTRSVVESDAL